MNPTGRYIVPQFEEPSRRNAKNDGTMRRGFTNAVNGWKKPFACG